MIVRGKPAEPFSFRIAMPHAIDHGAVRFLCPDREEERNALAVFEDECARIVREEVARAMEASGAVPEVERLRAERDKLQAFKDWVHAYLDEHKVPHHPPGPHGAEGCRIGDRLDWLMAALRGADEEVARLRRIVANGHDSHDCPAGVTPDGHCPACMDRYWQTHGPDLQIRVRLAESERDEIKSAADAEVARLRDLLNIDRSGMAAALVRVQEIAGGWAWVPRGEWGSYEYHERTEAALRSEVGNFIDAVVNTATAALRASGDNAIAAAQPDTVRALRAALDKLQRDYNGAVGHASEEESRRWELETKLLQERAAVDELLATSARLKNELAKLQGDHDKAVARGTDEAAHSWRVEGKLLTSERQNRALLSENARLHKELAAFADRIAAQSEALGRAAERDACARLEAWKKAHAEEGWCVAVSHLSTYTGWHVRLFRGPVRDSQADPRREIDAFSNRHPGDAMLGPFKGEAYCQHDDGTDATFAETLAAALDKWEEIHGQKRGKE